MPSIRLNYPRIANSLLIPAALALSACELKEVLGESPLEDTTSGATDGATSEPTTTETGGPMPVCTAGGGGDPGGTLHWSLAGDDLGFFPRATLAVADDLVLVGSLAALNGARDARVEVRDGDGAVKKWSQSYDGVQELDDVALGAVADGEGNIHVLVRETIVSVEGDQMGTYDARLVVLRYAPDGALQWRWQQQHAPVAEWSSYVPTGRIAVTGETIRVLVRAYDEPAVVFGLDEFGEEVSEVELATPPGLSVEQDALAADGSAYLAGDLEEPFQKHSLWIGRFALDGSLAWSEQFGSLDDSPTTLVPGREGDVLLAWSTSLPAGIENHLRRYDAAGAELWTVPLPPVGLDSGALSGALRCDDVVLLAGGSDRPPAPDSQWGWRRELWVAAYTLDGAQLWSRFQAFGVTESSGDGSHVASALDGDAIVVGSFLSEDGASSQSWLGRFAGG